MRAYKISPRLTSTSDAGIKSSNKEKGSRKKQSTNDACSTESKPLKMNKQMSQFLA